jgi:serine phosphatase RsbU (regulator of sigma subunit)
VRELYDHPEEAARDELVMRDGRVLDRYGAPVVDADGSYHGWIWSFRDVTAEKRAEDRLRFVGEVSAVLDASLDPATTLERVPRLLVPFLGDICSVRIARSDGGLELVALAASDTEQEAYARRIEQRHPIDVSGGHPAAEVLRTGRGRLLADIDEDARRAAARDAEHLAALEALGMTSTIVAPLRARGQTLGTLSVGRIGGGRRYDAEDVALVEDLARRAALAYDNARLYEERRRVAATLQASLLPERLPPLPGLELAARYRPATGHGEVGGDFYDAFAADAGGWLLAIGDVCGKGAEAASLTALTRHTIRAAAMAHERPAAIVDVLNEAIRRQVTDGRFCTVVLGHVHVQAQGAAVSLVRAGHPPPLVLRAGGAVEAVTPSGAAPGMLEELGLEEAELRLGPGDALVLYTDGLTDARTDGARLGDDAPERLLTGLAGAGAEAIADGVQRGLAELRAELLDDLAMLVLAVPHG